MSGDGVVIDRLDGASYAAAIPELAEVLIDCVDSGGGVSFMAPLAPLDAIRFWLSLEGEVATHRKIVLAARDAGGIVGTVQLHPCWQPNQPHRAEVAKLLVHRRARRRGIAAALMARIEQEARGLGRTLVTLDTETDGPAETLYRGLGYQVAGRIPDFALMSHGGLTATTILFKRLSPPAA
ncbi:MAG: GNAT family N-acetyltransferase [Hyphomicrobiaceae bacterium]